MSYLVDRYAEILTKYDVQNLFEWLQETYGNRRRASVELGLQRKTIYDWEKKTSEVRALTKRKILEASFKLNPERTMSFLVGKTSNDFKEILQRQFTLIYRRLINSKNSKGFQTSLSMFNEIRDTYRGAFLDLDPRRIDFMTKRINHKAKSFGLKGIPRSIRVTSPEHLARRFTELTEQIRLNRLTRKELVHSFDLPADFVESICDASAYMGPQSIKSCIWKQKGRLDLLSFDLERRDFRIGDTPILTQTTIMSGGIPITPLHALGARHK